MFVVVESGLSLWKSPGEPDDAIIKYHQIESRFKRAVKLYYFRDTMNLAELHKYTELQDARSDDLLCLCYPLVRQSAFEKDVLWVLTQAKANIILLMYSMLWLVDELRFKMSAEFHGIGDFEHFLSITKEYWK